MILISLFLILAIGIYYPLVLNKPTFRCNNDDFFNQFFRSYKIGNLSANVTPLGYVLFFGLMFGACLLVFSRKKESLMISLIALISFFSYFISDLIRNIQYLIDLTSLGEETFSQFTGLSINFSLSTEYIVVICLILLTLLFSIVVAIIKLIKLLAKKS